ncbi:MAG: peptidyl-prolyl cis-trans isomerase [Oligoflexales bacterium]|nr:peptidyl-prolyl cis-trans isomerase [Oligoflexales bacterium]
MAKKIQFAIGLVVIFLVGAYSWRIFNTDLVRDVNEGEKKISKSFSSQSILVNVGDIPVTNDEIEWEYKIQTMGVLEEDDLTPIPDPGDKFQTYLVPLKERLVGSIVERKLLYSLIKQDKEFDLTISSRYVGCLQEWHEVVKSGRFMDNEMEKLKDRMCERSIIFQYLEEKIFSKTIVSEDEIIDYFNSNRDKFRYPERVVIRQIVLPSESQARSVLGQVDRDNFAEYAKKYSIAPEAEEGGLLRPFSKDEMLGIFTIAFSMRKGEIRGVIKSAYGFHVIKLEDKLPKQEYGLSEARPNIVQILKKKKQEEDYQKWLELALNTIKISTPKPPW